MGLGAALGISTAANALGDIFRYKQEKGERADQRGYWKGQTKARRTGPEAQRLREIFSTFSETAEELPALMKREREGRLASEYEESMKRFRRNLARSGATRASTVGMAGERAIERDIGRRREAGELADVQTKAGLEAQQFGMGQRLLDAFYPSAGQSAQQYPTGRVTYNPFAAAGNVGQNIALAKMFEKIMEEGGD